MAHLTITVPREYVDELRRVLLRAHSDAAAALRRALDAYLENHDRLDDVQGALVELTDVHEALAQLGWAPGGALQEGTLTIHPELWADVLALLRDSSAGAVAACARVARLLDIPEFEARAILHIAGHAPITFTALQVEFALSRGGAVALIERLEREALVRHEPDPACQRRTRLRVSEGARLEITAALAPLDAARA